MTLKEDALIYHSKPTPGKVEVTTTKPCITQYDLSLAYTPGVAEPCLHIEKNPDDIYKYTSKGNLVAVISNGTAVLGLGDIGAGAGKPVMEGKGVLFKRFADIDVFDIEIDSKDPEEIINIVKKLEPTFGGINLEDIKAPECFEIEERLKGMMDIPVFHDDQHGTAIISGAGLINACEIQGKKLSEIIVVVNGAGASAISCAKHYEALGVLHKNIFMCDSRGVLRKGRTKGMNKYKDYFVQDTDKETLADAMVGADVFIGLSKGDVVSPEMLKTMAPKAIVFAMANPTSEIDYNLAVQTRSDIIMATGRSDFPNQINNVLGFPFIFRGALDVRSKVINDEMKVAATMALANLAKEDVPEEVAKAYGVDKITFGKDYIIPKPFDYRVLIWEAAAVAEAAMKTGVARAPVDLDQYKRQLEARLGRSRSLMRELWDRAKSDPKHIVYPEGANEKILRASQQIIAEGIAKPILLGDENIIKAKAEDLGVKLDGVEINDPSKYHKLEKYVEEYYKLRQRKGETRHDAEKAMLSKTYFAAMMVHMGDADGMVGGVSQHYHDTIRPALKVIGKADSTSVVAGMYIMIFKNTIKIIADTTVNIETTAESLADIAYLASLEAKRFRMEPRIAMLSFSNFGTSRHPLAEKVAKAVKILKEKHPELIVEGEMNADIAVNPEMLQETYPFTMLDGAANILICPDLQSGNIAYKLLQTLGGAEAIGPILMGMKKPVHLLQIGSSAAKDVVNMTAYAVVDAQQKK
ncbi:MAG TPA: NADP-dependent malic enzyme [Candidatus Marinimicrobia bacterium]|nr:NADP-dependent malic enzyme [Candidatus Neomarinimicrobiota bacterium]